MRLSCCPVGLYLHVMGVAMQGVWVRNNTILSHTVGKWDEPTGDQKSRRS